MFQENEVQVQLLYVQILTSHNARWEQHENDKIDEYLKWPRPWLSARADFKIVKITSLCPDPDITQRKDDKSAI